MPYASLKINEEHPSKASSTFTATSIEQTEGSIKVMEQRRTFVFISQGHWRTVEELLVRK